MRLISHWFIQYEPTEKKPWRAPPPPSPRLMMLHPDRPGNLICCGAVLLRALLTPPWAAAPWGTQLLEHPCCSSAGRWLSGWRWGLNPPPSPRGTSLWLWTDDGELWGCPSASIYAEGLTQRWWPLHRFYSSLLLESTSGVICCFDLPSAVIFMLSGLEYDTHCTL